MAKDDLFMLPAIKLGPLLISSGVSSKLMSFRNEQSENVVFVVIKFITISR